ncbi:unnamed protein product [Candidula unifasciata]|uniref:Ileal sodium/bile acid cotransporter n=1 Tax=Candidula unifasciata TaxID=100452 RepID=A0A8S3YX99_9EUPU|nr:unnamed protein product [Candidula unifasciata]
MDKILYCIFLTGLWLVPATLQSTRPTHNDNVTKSDKNLTVTSNHTFPYTIIDGEVSTLYFNYILEPDSKVPAGLDGWVVTAVVDHDKLVNIVSNSVFHIHTTNLSGTLSISLKGKLPGRATLIFQGRDEVTGAEDGVFKSDVKVYSQTSFELHIERQEKTIDIAFNVIIVILVVLANVGMGAKVDLSVVKTQLRRPFAPIIGLFSQFVFMPVIAFMVAYTLKLDPGIALGLFALGCSPGGSASNAYTYLLDGNVSLSVTMTLISTLASLGLLPMWLFTLGRVVYSEAKVKIPFENIFFSLLGIVIPVVVGFILQRKYPKAAICFIKAVKYIMIVFILFILTVGVYANLYIFSLMTGEVLLASALLPYVGFILGGLAAFICRQNLANIITIAVETGIQNTGIPIVLLRLSLTGPDKDTSIVSPIASAIFTPIPLLFGILFVQLRKCILANMNIIEDSGKEISQSGKESSKASLKEPDNLSETNHEDFK